MDVRTAFRARLIAVVPAVYWVSRPQNSALPDVTLSVISNPRDQHMQGFQALQFVRIRADCRAATYAAALALAETVIAAATPSVTSNGIYFRRAQVVGPRDLGDQTTSGFIYNQQVEFIIPYSPA